MAIIVERYTTPRPGETKGERRLYVVFHAKDRTTGKRRKVWELVRGGKKQADARKAKIETMLYESGYVWPVEEPTEEPVDEQAAQTFAEYVAWWLANRADARLRDGKITQRVRDAYVANANRYLCPALGDVALGELRRHHVYALVNDLASRETRPLAHNSIRNNVLSPLRKMLGDAVKEERIDRNPAAGIEVEDIPGRAPKQPKCPTPDELERILENASADARDVIRVAASEGLGIGEVFALRWKDVGEHAITVERQNYRGTVVDRTKTKARHRSVPLFPTARAVLDARKARLGPEQTWPESFVFASPFGGAENPDDWRRRKGNWDDALELAELERRYDFHELRKFASTQLREQGADDRLRSHMVLGHADTRITNAVYTPMTDAALALAAEQFDPLRG